MNMEKVIKCRLCGEAVAKRSQPFEKRMSLLREHYRENHQKEFRKLIKKGVAARKARKKKKK